MAGTFVRPVWPILMLPAIVAGVRIDEPMPSDDVVGAALVTDCLPALLRSTGVTVAGPAASALVGFDVDSPYLGANPFELQVGRGAEDLLAELRHADKIDHAVPVWPVAVRFAVPNGDVRGSDTTSAQCFALHDASGQLRVIDQQPDEQSGWATRQYSRLRSWFR